MASLQCKECGGLLRRSRRSAFERLFFFEAFRCTGCQTRIRTARFNPKNARYVKCPCCHSVDLTILAKPDRVDRMQKSLLNMLQRLAGGRLYHCWFCRIQFYDARQRFRVPRPTADPVLARPEEPGNDVKIAS